MIFEKISCIKIFHWNLYTSLSSGSLGELGVENYGNSSTELSIYFD